MLQLLKTIFGIAKSLIEKAFAASAEAGLTDEIVDLALRWVRAAAERTVDNAERREWVVAILKANRIPESIARLAVELAYQFYKKEIATKLAEETK